MPNRSGSMSDMQKELYQIYQSLGEIKGTLREVKQKLDETVEAQNDNHDGLETRVRKVEGGQKLHTGVAIGISSVASYLINHLFKI